MAYMNCPEFVIRDDYPDMLVRQLDILQEEEEVFRSVGNTFRADLAHESILRVRGMLLADYNISWPFWDPEDDGGLWDDTDNGILSSEDNACDTDSDGDTSETVSVHGNMPPDNICDEV